MDSQMQVLTFSCTIVWLIVGFVGYSNGRPMSDVSPSDVTHITDASSGNLGSAVVPQVGFLEERDNVVKYDKDTSVPNGNTGNGILVPIVSVVDGHDTSANSPNPLVALLPAPSVIGQSTDASKLPVVATLPIIPGYDPAKPKTPEIRRSVPDASSSITINARPPYNGASSEMMDVAEDIVFRPLFRIHQTARNNPAYSNTNFLRRNNLSNYRRYNVHGYYRLPYNYIRYNSNYYNNRREYDNDRSSADYYNNR